MKKQLKQLTGDTAIYGVTTILQRFLSFILTPFYTHFLTPTQLGLQANIFVVISFIMVFANFGMESAFFRFYALSSDEDKKKVYWNALVSTWFVSFLISMFLILTPNLFNQIAYLQVPDSQLYLIRYAGIIIFFDVAAGITLSLLRMTNNAKKFGAIKIISIAANVALNVVLLVFVKMEIEGVFIANIIQSVIQLLLTLGFVNTMRPVVFSKNIFSEMIKFGVPTIAAGLSAMVLQNIDRPIMQALSGSAAVGLYQASYRLGMFMMIFVSMFEFAWRPFFLQNASDKNAKKLFSKVFTYFNLVAIILFLFISFFIVFLATTPIPFTHGRTFIAEAFWAGLNIVPVVLLAYLFNGWYTNFLVGIYIEKKTKSLPFITAIGASLEAIICFAAIPIIGLMGGAVATLVGYVTMSLSLLFYVKKYYLIQYEWGKIGILFLCAGSLFFINYFLFDFMDTSLNSMLVKLFLLVLFPIILYFLKFFSATEITEIKTVLNKFKIKLN